MTDHKSVAGNRHRSLHVVRHVGACGLRFRTARSRRQSCCDLLLLLLSLLSLLLLNLLLNLLLRLPLLNRGGSFGQISLLLPVCLRYGAVVRVVVGVAKDAYHIVPCLGAVSRPDVFLPTFLLSHFVGCLLLCSCRHLSWRANLSF